MIRRTRESRGEVYYPPEFRRIAVERRLTRERLPSRFAMWCTLHSGAAWSAVAFVTVVVLSVLAWGLIVYLAMESRAFGIVVAVAACAVGLWSSWRGTR